MVASGRVGWAIWLRIAVNYLVPYLVASAGYLSARRRLPGSESGVNVADTSADEPDRGAG